MKHGDYRDYGFSNIDLMERLKQQVHSTPFLKANARNQVDHQNVLLDIAPNNKYMKECMQWQFQQSNEIAPVDHTSLAHPIRIFPLFGLSRPSLSPPPQQKKIHPVKKKEKKEKSIRVTI